MTHTAILNVRNRKIGGIRFLSLGRINIQFSVTSREAFAAKLNAKRNAELSAFLEANGLYANWWDGHCEDMAMVALERELAVELNASYGV